MTWSRYLETLRYGEDPDHPHPDINTKLPILLHVNSSHFFHISPIS